MCTNSKIFLLFICLFTQTLFAQNEALFESYLEGDYYNIIAKSSNSNQLYLASAHAHLDHYKQADSLFRSLSPQVKKSGLYLNEKGFLLLKMFQLDQAKSNFEKALALSQTTNDQEGIRLSATNLALYHFAVGNAELQHDFASKALNTSLALYGEKVSITARMYNNLALALASLEKNEESLKYYQLALTHFKSKKATYINPYICRVKINVALLNLKLANQDLAEKSALDALNYTNNESNNKIFVYITLGTIYSDLKELEFAENYLNEALKLNQKDHTKERIEILNYLANVARLKGNYNTATNLIDSAIASNKLNPNEHNSLDNLLAMDACLSSYYIKGQTYFDHYYKNSLKPKHLKAAIKSFEHCITILDEERKLRVTQKDKIRLGEISKGIYDKMIKACYDLSRNTFHKQVYEQQVFLHIQQSKATVLNESLNENEALLFSGVPEEIIQKERLLKSKVMYYEQLVSIDQSIQKNIDSLAALRTLYRNFITKLEKNYPKYYKLKYEKNIKPASTIQQTLKENTVLCSYYLSSDASMVYVAYLDKNRFIVNEVYAGKQLLNDITKFRNFIYYRLSKGYNKLSNQLYTLLIPSPKFLKNKSIVFFPDGELNAIPFEALSYKRTKTDGEWQTEPFMIHTNQISYGVSTALYKPYTKGHLATYSLYAPLTFKYDSGETYQDLPATEKEILAIDSVTTTAEVKLFLGKDVNKQNIINNDANVIHLATHGLINQEKPQLSKLCLAPNQNGDFLYNNDIYNLQTNSDLVTMSACETGLGKISKGEGIIGLTRAWVYAGAKNIIVSYWSVSDQATDQLMTSFYTNVTNGKSFSGSLQQAKLDLIKNKATQAPFYWAGFVLIGE